MKPEVIYSDKGIIVLNKPAGLAVHGGPQVRGETLVDFLLEKFPEIKEVGDVRPAQRGEARSFPGNERPGIVHRLDKNTSGVMVVARTQESFLALKEIFQKRLVEKTYWAICCGIFKEGRGAVTYPVGRLVSNPLKRGAAVGKTKIRGAREALTEYHVLRQGEELALVELKPKTGRMHQLRVHMASIHHPVACDTVYGGKKVCCPTGITRHLLHASALSFSYPEGRKLHFEADPPEDFVIAERQIV